MSSPAWHAERTSRWGSALSFALPLLLYIPLIPFGVAGGDAGELLVAMYHGGVAHPSGYPLLTMLGHVPSRLLLGTPHFNVALLLCALPAALTSWVLFRAQRHLDVHWGPALVASLTWALGPLAFAQATRVEVYALHTLLVTSALYATLRYTLEPQRRRWLFAAALFGGLGCANHLTAAFITPALALGAALASWRALLRPRNLAAVAAILAGCASLYLYLPLAAWLADASAPAWNAPSSWEAFVFHVTGAEYARFRDASALASGLVELWRGWAREIFPGAPLLTALGAVAVVRRAWRWLLVLALALAPVVLYTATYTIGDIAAYYPPLFAPLAILTGAGLGWLREAGFWERLGRAAPLREAPVVIAAAMTLWHGWGALAMHDAATQPGAMARQVAAAMPPRAIVLTEVDDHTFPLWYEAYVERPRRDDLVVVDRLMFSTPSKRWYRDFLRRRHPEVEWPDEELATQRGRPWERWLIEKNRARYRAFALLATPWRGEAYRPVNRGWYHELVPAGELEEHQRGHEVVARVYTARARERAVGAPVFHRSARRYAEGDAIACVVEWFEHEPMRPQWTFVGPGSQRHVFEAHDLGEGASVTSWELLLPDMQAPGEWRCEVSWGSSRVSTTFEVTR